MVADMLQNIRNLPTLVRGSGHSAADDRVEVMSTRFNPWLRWRPKRPAHPHVLSVAELAECMCPDLCDRDHANE
jgi:hypothetical protein